jgi:hypothetical protein
LLSSRKPYHLLHCFVQSRSKHLLLFPFSSRKPFHLPHCLVQSQYKHLILFHFSSRTRN